MQGGQQQSFVQLKFPKWSEETCEPFKRRLKSSLRN